MELESRQKTEVLEITHIPSATFRSTNLTRTGLRLNPGRRGEKPATGCVKPWHCLVYLVYGTRK